MKDDYDWFTLRATGDGILFTIESDLPRVPETWQDLTGYAEPTIRHLRLENCSAEVTLPRDVDDTVISLLADVHTMEVGRDCLQLFYTGFLDDLKQLGSQLKTIRFEVPEDAEPFKKPARYEDRGGYMLDDIEDLVKCRFERGRPFSLVERMVVSESEEVDRQQAYVWRSFYYDRCLDQYVRPES